MISPARRLLLAEACPASKRKTADMGTAAGAA